ncbi:hypothetical protein CDL15_Pgr002714 [Punica granatum]|uniref:Uncharacterized protein n=1 Tax=Punica granatum TaxID=22663 RepID=A0A218Y1V8_PUNGR|nr:hypothetical protein CDL15_Pgr002714 [Punica granatum]
MHSGLSRPSRSILAHAFGSTPAIQVYPGSCIRVYPGHTGLSWLMHSGLSRPFRSILAHAFGSILAHAFGSIPTIQVHPGPRIRVCPGHSGPSWFLLVYPGFKFLVKVYPGFFRVHPDLNFQHNIPTCPSKAQAATRSGIRAVVGP